jgi:hypothetical protein
VSRQHRVLLACECSARVRNEFAARGWEAVSADLLPCESEDCDYRLLSPGRGDLIDGVAHGRARHYQGDVRDLFSWDHSVNSARKRANMSRIFSPQLPLWDLVIAFPPCTALSLAGARWWKEKRADGRQDAAAKFFMEMYNAPARFVAVENPVGDMSRRFRRPDQVVEPWWFGDPYSKRTCLWIRNADKPSYRVTGTDEALPLLVTSNSVAPIGRVTTGGGSHRTDKAAGRKAMNAYEDSEGRANRAKVRSRTFPGFAQALASQWGAFVERQALGKELAA